MDDKLDWLQSSGLPGEDYGYDAFIAARDADLEAATQADAWVSEGAFIGVSQVALRPSAVVVD